jgi:hypothetical protein
MWPQWWIVKKPFGVICFYGWNWFCDFFEFVFAWNYLFGIVVVFVIVVLKKLFYKKYF